ncbi:MAG: hypothetical protein HYY96_08470 [Candidatus Tectomicrobia bacterium]|nr:hypothetical protein [Candidatus Tectomicrobia bacterium]
MKHAPEEVKQIARHLIETVNEFEHLGQASILYVMEDKAPKRRLASASKVGGRLAGILELIAPGDTPDFIITVYDDVWQDLTEDQKHALIDHELSHCGWDRKKQKWTMVDHDVQDFVGTIKRHGLVFADTKALGEVVQLSLAEAQA